VASLNRFEQIGEGGGTSLVHAGTVVAVSQVAVPLGLCGGGLVSSLGLTLTSQRHYTVNNLFKYHHAEYGKRVWTSKKLRNVNSETILLTQDPLKSDFNLLHVHGINIFFSQ
jgi:hypothetical protein